MEKRKFTNVSIVQEGNKIILPEGMALEDAVMWIERHDEEQNSYVAFERRFNAYPLDGAVAFHSALGKRFGWTKNVPTPGFFGSDPPRFITVDTGPTSRLSVPWGRVQVPAIKGYLETNMQFVDKQWRFHLHGQVVKKHLQGFEEIADLVEDELRHNSIYKGKAFKAQFGKEGQDFSPLENQPQFLTLGTTKEDLIFPVRTMQAIEANLFTLVEKREECERFGIPTKRGVTLAGTHGCGKSMTAYALAHSCETNGVTFIYVSDCRDLSDAMLFARQYAPAVVFGEDIDRVISKKRTSEVDAIFNMVDGVETKNSDIMLVLTTNDIEAIHKGFLREKRGGDFILNVQLPDQDAASRLLSKYGVVLPEEELLAAGAACEGLIPAAIEEVAHRSRLHQIATGAEGITLDNVCQSAYEVKAQQELLSDKAVDPNADKIFGTIVMNELATG